jgi:hypothetical protein
MAHPDVQVRDACVSFWSRLAAVMSSRVRCVHKGY